MKNIIYMYLSNFLRVCLFLSTETSTIVTYDWNMLFSWFFYWPTFWSVFCWYFCRLEIFCKFSFVRTKRVFFHLMLKGKMKPSGRLALVIRFVLYELRRGIKGKKSFCCFFVAGRAQRAEGTQFVADESSCWLIFKKEGDHKATWK